MTLLHSILLGLIQGFTEFLPVSSSGHLVLFETIFGLDAETGLLFDVLLHFGTLLAVFIAFWRDIWELVLAFFRLAAAIFSKKARARLTRENLPAVRLLLLFVVATLPMVLILPVKDFFEGLRQYVWLVGVALIVTGFLLFFSDRASKGKKTERSATWLDALCVGVMQAIAVTPGISRSGASITAGIFRGFDRAFAVKFSFILSIPAVLGAVVLETGDAIREGINTSLLPIYLAGMAVAAVSGFFAIKLIKYIANKGKFGWFAYYCWAAGIITVIATIVK